MAAEENNNAKVNARLRRLAGHEPQELGPLAGMSRNELLEALVELKKIGSADGPAAKAVDAELRKRQSPGGRSVADGGAGQGTPRPISAGEQLNEKLRDIQRSRSGHIGIDE